MFTGIQEHDKVHLIFSRWIVVFEELLDLLDHLSKVINLLVDTLVDINAFIEVSENESVGIIDLFAWYGKFSLAPVNQLIIEPFAFLSFN